MQPAHSASCSVRDPESQRLYDLSPLAEKHNHISVNSSGRLLCLLLHVHVTEPVCTDQHIVGSMEIFGVNSTIMHVLPKAYMCIQHTVSISTRSI